MYPRLHHPIVPTVLILLALIGSGCGGGSRSDVIASAAGLERPLRDGAPYTQQNSDGTSETKYWTEGRVVAINDQYQIVQASDYEGPPVYVDDAYKATMPSCDVPAGATWTSGDDEGVYEAGELRLIVGATPCVIRAAGDTGPGQAAAPPAASTPVPTATQLQPATVEPQAGATEIPNEPAVPTTLLAQFETTRHETVVSEMSVQVPAPVAVAVETNAAFGFDTYSYTFDDGDKYVLVEVKDSADFFTDNETREFEENIAARSKIGADNGADLLELFYGIRGVTRRGDGRAVSATVTGGASSSLAGYEVELDVGARAGYLRYFRLDGVIYTLVAIGVSDLEWEAFADSFAINQIAAPAPELTDEERAERAAATAAVAELTGGDRFVAGPYPPRILDPITGGWRFLDAPPFGAEEPGEDADLDPDWIACRQGNGFACDTLAIEGLVGSAYQHFGLTCGGRSAVVDCAELLGSDPHPGFSAPYDDTKDLYRNRLRGFRLDRIPGPDSPPPGTDPIRDLQWAQCGIQANSSSCFALTRDRGAVPDIYEAYGMSCGGRRSWESQACFLMFSDSESRIVAGSAPPETYDANADQRWRACDADESECFALSILSIGVASDRADDFAPYGQFAHSCGGEYERPFTELTLSGGCRAPYANLPTIGDISDLPSPPSG